MIGRSLLLSTTLLIACFAQAQQPARNPYVSEAAWYEIEPDYDFIYRVIGQSVALVDEAPDSDAGDCYRVLATIEDVGDRKFAFALIPDQASGEHTWLAAGEDCGDRDVPIDTLEQQWSVPIDEPRPAFVFQVIGESITQIIDIQYLDSSNKYRLTANVADTKLCILMLEARSEPRHEWTVGGVECSTHADMQETMQREGYLELK